MSALHLAHTIPLAVNLNQPGTFLTWSIFDISVANLIVIAVMVVIFGAALLIPFPHAGRNALTAAPGSPDSSAAEGADPAVIAAAPDPGDEGMWTARARTMAARLLPPKKLLPDRQPAYVASWVYVFGVGSLAALAWRSSRASPSLSAVPTGGITTRWGISSTARTCGASSCSWRFW